MKGVILKVTEPIRSKSGDGMFQWVFFKDMETGLPAKMCLPHNSTSFRNWDGALRAGNVLDDLNVIHLHKKTGRFYSRAVDINSHPRLVTTIDLNLIKAHA